jgi:type I restriction enzyme R subunit
VVVTIMVVCDGPSRARVKAGGEFQPHIYSKEIRKDLKLRAKDPDDPLELVIVRDMWLTGFDAPSMHTMYVDKTMQGAG